VERAFVYDRNQGLEARVLPMALKEEALYGSFTHTFQYQFYAYQSSIQEKELLQSHETK